MVTTISNSAANPHAPTVIEAIERKMGQGRLRCPVCEDVNWAVQEFPAILPATNAFGVRQPLMEMRLSYPMAMVICQTCGYSMMFNLFALGVGEDIGMIPLQEVS